MSVIYDTKPIEMRSSLEKEIPSGLLSSTANLESAKSFISRPFSSNRSSLEGQMFRHFRTPASSLPLVDPTLYSLSQIPLYDGGTANEDYQTPKHGNFTPNHDIKENESIMFSQHMMDDLKASQQDVVHFGGDKDVAENLFQCPLCCSAYDEKGAKNCLGCMHEFCNQCLSQYIQARIDTLSVTNLKCPADKCEYTLTKKDVASILDKQNYRRYQEAIKIKAQIKTLNNIYCPKPGCARLLAVNPNQEFTQCVCGTSTCNRCLLTRHDGKTCFEQAKGLLDLQRRNWRKRTCIVCKHVTEKNEKTSHIKCENCDYEWCWTCGREYQPGHAGRCIRKWDPKPPSMFTSEKKPNAFVKFCKALILIPESTLYFIMTMVGVALFWPLGGYRLVIKEKKNTRSQQIKDFLLGLLTWGLAIIAVPMKATVDEYGVFYRKGGRWRKGEINPIEKPIETPENVVISVQETEVDSKKPSSTPTPMPPTASIEGRQLETPDGVDSKPTMMQEMNLKLRKGLSMIREMSSRGVGDNAVENKYAKIEQDLEQGTAL